MGAKHFSCILFGLPLWAYEIISENFRELNVFVEVNREGGN